MANPHRSDGNRVLNGARLLIVEDDFLLLMELETVLRDAGAESVQACRTIDEALAAIDAGDFAAAVLDVRIDRDSIGPVARKLAAHGTRIVFYTGQVDNERMMAEWPQCRVLSKPAPPRVIVKTVAELLTTLP
jgi:DNA-binding response OmpR family regulator